MRLFIILGAGASVDSGLPTYRGPSGVYDSMIEPESILSPSTLYGEKDGPQIIWDFLEPLYQEIKSSVPGPTYLKLQQLIEKNPGSFILTQNIDGHATSLTCPVVEIHGTHKTMQCIKCQHQAETNFDKLECDCGGKYRPNIVLFDELLEDWKVRQVQQMCKWVDLVLVIGTTMQFPYLREFISSSKHHGAKVIHINPDDTYINKVRPNEKWIQKTAAEGLDELLQGQFEIFI